MTDFPPPGGTAAPPPSGASGPAPGWWQASDGNWYPPDQVPGYGAPGVHGYGYAPRRTKSTNGFAIASLVTAIIACGFGSIFAIIFGHVALSQIKNRDEEGKGMAMAGLVIGYVGLAVIVFAFIALFALGSSAESRFDEIDTQVGMLR